MSIYDKYESVIGLEVHAQLSTNSKMYCADDASYGGAPNTQVSPISSGLPGTLPVVNEEAIRYAIKMGFATNCEINERNEFARKNYFYADLPKGYQITQDKTPICTNGHVMVQAGDAEAKRIGITRIHMEEDAGKSMHDLDPYHSLIDLNRAGVPLIEIVTEPDLRSAEEAAAYLTEIRKMVRYLEICDGNMEEGSLRCDANISVRLKGATEFGERAEVKNMNSIRNVKKAIEFEIKRQIDIIEEGGRIEQQTRTFDAVSGETFMMRSKEEAHDYRYFPEPDLPPVILDEKEVDSVRSSMPALPKELMERYVKEYGLSDYDAEVLTGERAISDWFNQVCAHTNNYKAAANWVSGPIKSYLNENALDITALPITPNKVAQIIALTDEGKVNFSSASQRLLPLLLETPDADPLTLATENNLIQESDASVIDELAKEVLDKNPEKVAEYRSGKKGLLGMFMGELMKASKGKADPKQASQILKKMLDDE